MPTFASKLKKKYKSSAPSNVIEAILVLWADSSMAMGLQKLQILITIAVPQLLARKRGLRS